MIRVDLTPGETIALGLFVLFLIAVIIGGVLNYRDQTKGDPK